MKMIETKVDTTGNETMIIPVPPGLSPGEHSVVVIIEEATTPSMERRPLPVVSVGRWPEGLSLRRQDIYGDNGR